MDNVKHAHTYIEQKTKTKTLVANPVSMAQHLMVFFSKNLIGCHCILHITIDSLDETRFLFNIAEPLLK